MCNFKPRLGSFDKKAQLAFNWNIINAPRSIVDYVVVHELCHLVHHDHSKKFWELVRRYVHAYQEHRE